MYEKNLYEFRVLTKILSDLVDDSIISEWQAGLITGAFCIKNNIACFTFENIQNPRPVGDETDKI